MNHRTTAAVGTQTFSAQASRAQVLDTAEKDQSLQVAYRQRIAYLSSRLYRVDTTLSKVISIYHFVHTQIFLAPLRIVTESTIRPVPTNQPLLLRHHPCVVVSLPSYTLGQDDPESRNHNHEPSPEYGLNEQRQTLRQQRPRTTWPCSS